MTVWEPEPCPFPRKRRLVSKREAERALARLRRSTGGAYKVQVYRCGDHWHLGHAPQYLRKQRNRGQPPGLE